MYNTHSQVTVSSIIQVMFYRSVFIYLIRFFVTDWGLVYYRCWELEHVLKYIIFRSLVHSSIIVLYIIYILILYYFVQVFSLCQNFHLSLLYFLSLFSQNFLQYLLLISKSSFQLKSSLSRFYTRSGRWISDSVLVLSKFV